MQIDSYGGSGGGTANAISSICSADCEVCESQLREKLHKILHFLHIHKCIFMAAAAAATQSRFASRPKSELFKMLQILLMLQL